MSLRHNHRAHRLAGEMLQFVEDGVDRPGFERDGARDDLARVQRAGAGQLQQQGQFLQQVVVRADQLGFVAEQLLVGVDSSSGLV